jgi:polyisoprenoid-binding protein YceI
MNTPDENPNHARPSRWLKRSLIVAVAAVVLLFGGILLYAKVINDSPDQLGITDLNEALSTDTRSTDPASGPPATDPPATEASATDPSSTPTAVVSVAPVAESAAGNVGSTWQATDASELGYRVKEVLFGVDTEAVGRTHEVTGTLAIEGTQVVTTEFSVPVASITSDESRRDNRFKGNIMSADQFPTATFALTAPIELGAEPAEGLGVTTRATGDLTMRGVTNSVTFDVTAKLENGKIGVLGSIPVVFADYKIANPSFGGIKTEDNGLIEFVLVFEQV